MSEVPLYTPTAEFPEMMKKLAATLLEGAAQLQVPLYTGYSKVMTRTALGSYCRARPRGTGPP